MMSDIVDNFADSIVFEHVDLIVLGRLIGTYTGWDEADTFSMIAYNLVKAPGYTGPEGDVVINFMEGTITSADEDGSVNCSVNLIEAIKDCIPVIV